MLNNPIVLGIALVDLVLLMIYLLRMRENIEEETNRQNVQGNDQGRSKPRERKTDMRTIAQQLNDHPANVKAQYKEDRMVTYQGGLRHSLESPFKEYISPNHKEPQAIDNTRPVINGHRNAKSSLELETLPQPKVQMNPYDELRIQRKPAPVEERSLLAAHSKPLYNDTERFEPPLSKKQRTEQGEEIHYVHEKSKKGLKISVPDFMEDDISTEEREIQVTKKKTSHEAAIKREQSKDLDLSKPKGIQAKEKIPEVSTPKEMTLLSKLNKQPSEAAPPIPNFSKNYSFESSASEDKGTDAANKLKSTAIQAALEKKDEPQITENQAVTPPSTFLPPQQPVVALKKANSIIAHLNENVQQHDAVKTNPIEEAKVSKEEKKDKNEAPKLDLKPINIPEILSETKSELGTPKFASNQKTDAHIASSNSQQAASANIPKLNLFGNQGGAPAGGIASLAGLFKKNENQTEGKAPTNSANIPLVKPAEKVDAPAPAPSEPIKINFMSNNATGGLFSNAAAKPSQGLFNNATPKEDTTNQQKAAEVTQPPAPSTSLYPSFSDKVPNNSTEPQANQQQKTLGALFAMKKNEPTNTETKPPSIGVPLGGLFNNLAKQDTSKNTNNTEGGDGQSNKFAGLFGGQKNTAAPIGGGLFSKNSTS